MVRDSLLRSAPFVASAVRLALFALSILRCRGTPRPVALGPTPLPKGTTSSGGGRCPREPHARSHSGPMHVGEDVRRANSPPNVPCTVPRTCIRTTASALLHPHYCKHPRRCGLHRLGCDAQVLQQELLGNANSPTPRYIQVLQQELLYLCYDEQTSASIHLLGWEIQVKNSWEIQVLQQELLSLCYDEQTSALPRASTCLGGKSESRTLGKHRFSNKNSSPSAMTSRHPQ